MRAEGWGSRCACLGPSSSRTAHRKDVDGDFPNAKLSPRAGAKWSQGLSGKGERPGAGEISGYAARPGSGRRGVNGQVPAIIRRQPVFGGTPHGRTVVDSYRALVVVVRAALNVSGRSYVLGGGVDPRSCHRVRPHKRARGSRRVCATSLPEGLAESHMFTLLQKGRQTGHAQ